MLVEGIISKNVRFLLHISLSVDIMTFTSAPKVIHACVAVILHYTYVMLHYFNITTRRTTFLHHSAQLQSFDNKYQFLYSLLHFFPIANGYCTLPIFIHPSIHLVHPSHTSCPCQVIQIWMCSIIHIWSGMVFRCIHLFFECYQSIK